MVGTELNTTLSTLTMAEIQSLSLFVNERLTMAAIDILGVVEKVVAQYQEEISRSKEENVRLRSLLRFTPEVEQIPIQIKEETEEHLANLEMMATTVLATARLYQTIELD
ncbi:hypothetical protein UPYG_G00042460 [Umbra pygmaea]|uniref:Uncharacterized protein n=1 Tax=Umbra pygmaea TaxID=75934 RepID=A0ABD0Y5X3_UMBPY